MVTNTEHETFRAEVRAFLKENLDPEVADFVRRHTHHPKELTQRWQKALYNRGWAAPSWPKEYGGTGWTPAQRYIFEEECTFACAPSVSPFGLTMIGPVLYTFGSQEQKDRYLPGILTGEEYWCQGYSEPGSGSDLASLSTRAERQDDSYVINGSKIWTTESHFADLMFCLVRTDPTAKPQSGISFLLIDLRKTSGITISPIVSIDKAHSLNQVFFEDVRVPLDALLGEENKGWDYAKFLLGHERVMTSGVSRSRQKLNELKDIAKSERLEHSTSLLSDPQFGRKVADLEIQLMALEAMSERVLARAEDAGRLDIEPSILKLRGSEIMQAVHELSCDALGYYALPYEYGADRTERTTIGPSYAEGVVEDHLYRRAATIWGGSSETQRNIISKQLFRK